MKYHYSSLAGDPTQWLMGLGRLLVDDLMDFGLEYSFDCPKTNPSCFFSLANFWKGKYLLTHSQHTLTQAPHHIRGRVYWSIDKLFINSNINNLLKYNSYD